MASISETSIPQLVRKSYSGESIPILGSVRQLLVFISVYCEHCIDLLPHLNTIRENHPIQLSLFSTGDDDDHNEMAEYFNWSFPIFHMELQEMEHYFGIKKLPAVVIVNEHGVILHKGIVYHASDFDALISRVTP